MKLFTIVLSITLMISLAQAFDNDKQYAFAKFEPYPGSESNVTGKMFYYYSEQTHSRNFIVELELLDKTELCSCHAEECDETANACGIHVHSGTTCETADEVGGHYFTVEKDPWTGKNGDYYNNKDSVTTFWTKMYTDTGYTVAQDVGHAFVVHDNKGGRIGCGVLSQNPMMMPEFIASQSVSTLIGLSTQTLLENLDMIQAIISPYPDSNSTTRGHVFLHQNGDQITMTYNLDGLDWVCDCVGADCDTTANSCGIHIHVGTSCEVADDVGGHWYTDPVTADPWTGAHGGFYNNYFKSKSGYNILDTSIGYTLDQDVGHAFVVHDNNGSRMGCGILTQ